MAFRAGKTFAITQTGSSIRKALGTDNGQVEISASGGTIYVNLGSSTVDADDTVTSNALADGNFVVLNGQSKLYSLRSGQTHVATKGTASHVAFITVGHGAQI